MRRTTDAGKSDSYTSAATRTRQRQAKPKTTPWAPQRIALALIGRPPAEGNRDRRNISRGSEGWGGRENWGIQTNGKGALLIVLALRRPQQRWSHRRRQRRQRRGRPPPRTGRGLAAKDGRAGPRAVEDAASFFLAAHVPPTPDCSGDYVTTFPFSRDRPPRLGAHPRSLPPHRRPPQLKGVFENPRRPDTHPPRLCRERSHQRPPASPGV